MRIPQMWSTGLPLCQCQLKTRGGKLLPTERFEARDVGAGDPNENRTGKGGLPSSHGLGPEWLMERVNKKWGAVRPGGRSAFGPGNFSPLCRSSSALSLAVLNVYQ
jgi:hypothetical protein